MGRFWLGLRLSFTPPEHENKKEKKEKIGIRQQVMGRRHTSQHPRVPACSHIEVQGFLKAGCLAGCGAAGNVDGWHFIFIVAGARCRWWGHQTSFSLSVILNRIFPNDTGWVLPAVGFGLFFRNDPWR